jgi:alpha-mannosidase
LNFEYALVPHSGDWRQAGIYRDGMEFNNPLVVCTASSHAGVLPARWGFLEISHPNVVVSALKGGPKGTAALRVYEAAGQPTREVKIMLSGHVVAAEEVNLMEDPGQKLNVAADALQFDFRPFEIKTIKLELQRTEAPSK